MNKSVLIVDDSATLRASVHFTLSEKGYEVFQAENGQQGLQLLAELSGKGGEIGMIITDVNMPVMDGIETLRGLKRIDPDCVVVMLTSLANRQTIDDAAKNGASNYIRKDAPFEEIGRALAETIDTCFGSEPPEAGAPPAPFP